MQPITQVIEIIKTFLQTNLVGWNLPSAIALGVAAAATVVIVPKISKKALFLVRKRNYRKKLSKVENKIKEYSKTKNSKNLVKNLKAREVLRKKAAKKNIGLKNEPGLNHITYSQSKLSKESRKSVIKDAKSNLLKIKGSSKSFNIGEDKGTGKTDALERDLHGQIEISETIDCPGFGNLALTTNSISASKKNPIFIEHSVKNYKKDLTSPNFPTRLGKLGIYPLVIEIDDENNDSLLKISDTSPRRFLKYSTDAFAYMYSVLSKNMMLPSSEGKSFKVAFYDTGDQKAVKQMHAVIGSTADLDQFLGRFDWNFGQVKPIENEGFTDDFKIAIKNKSKEFEYFKKSEQSNKQEKNSFIYAKNLSNNLKSTSLENGFKKIVETNTYTSYDSEPQITTLLIDGKEVFKTRVESKDLFNITDRVVDAYIFTLIAKRMIDTGLPGRVVKTTEGTFIEETEKGKDITQEKKYGIRTEEVTDIGILYERNKYRPEFFAAFLAVAKDFKLAVPEAFFNACEIELREEHSKLLADHLGQYEDKNKALEIFGILENSNERKDTSYQSVGENPLAFEEAQKIFKPEIVEKADHFRGSIATKRPKQKITTTIPDLEKSFNEEVATRKYALKGIPHTADIICEDNETAEVHFKLGATAYDEETFKEYLHKILIESFYLIGESEKLTNKELPIEVYISFANKKGKNQHVHKFNSKHELRREVEDIEKNAGFINLKEFKEKYFDNSNSGKDM